MSSSSSLLATVALLGGLIATGFTSPAVAQDSATDIARCQALYSQWQHYDSASHYSPQLAVDTAGQDCRNGKATQGIAELTKILERNRMPVPPAETASTPK